MRVSDGGERGGGPGSLAPAERRPTVGRTGRRVLAPTIVKPGAGIPFVSIPLPSDVCSPLPSMREVARKVEAMPCHLLLCLFVVSGALTMAQSRGRGRKSRKMERMRRHKTDMGQSSCRLVQLAARSQSAVSRLKTRQAIGPLTSSNPPWNTGRT